MTARNGDREFLARCFQKLPLNFTWWVNRKDVLDRHVFTGGFLGPDNIGIFDRSKPLPTGGYLEQADGTAWMAYYCSSMLSIAFELADGNPAYEDMASKFFEHYMTIAAAMNSLDGCGLWDEEVPGESDSGMFGGNSNWRGPVWFPLNYILIEAFERYHQFYGDDLRVECPTGSGNLMNLKQVANELRRRLSLLFLTNESGVRPCYARGERFVQDPHWCNLVLFYEYFHGDTGRGQGRQPPDGLDGPDRLVFQTCCKIFAC